MTDLTAIMHARHALSAIREQFNSRLDEVEAILDRALPADDPGPGVGVPHTREARRRHYKKNGIRAGGLHDASITRRLSKAMKTTS